MKWKEFIKLVKKAGIDDDDEIWFIDFHGDETELCIFLDKWSGWSIS